ncbi:hypothetical protein M8494_28090 [Serratia ureilytica]
MWRRYKRSTTKGCASPRRQDSCLPVDTVVICAGQEPRRRLQQPRAAMGVRDRRCRHLPAGARDRSGTRLAMALAKGLTAP